MYVNLFNWLVNLIIPTTLLVVLNCLIYRALRKNKFMGEQLRRNGGGQKESLRKRDVRLTRIAIAIVCVFICCHLPRFIPNLVELFTELPKVFLTYNVTNLVSFPHPPNNNKNIMNSWKAVD